MKEKNEKDATANNTDGLGVKSNSESTSGCTDKIRSRLASKYL